MEEIFIQALVTRTKMEAGLIDQLPDDVKILVEEKLLMEVQDAEVITNSQLAE